MHAVGQFLLGVTGLRAALPYTQMVSTAIHMYVCTYTNLETPALC